MVEGPEGNIWMGTNEGLIKHNGSEFTRYDYPGYSNAYSNIKFDSLGRPWCHNFDGQLFYLNGDSMEICIKSANGSGFIQNYFLDQLPNIYLTFESPAILYRYSTIDKTYEPVTDKKYSRLTTNSFKPNTITALASKTKENHNLRFYELLNINLTNEKIKTKKRIPLPNSNGKKNIIHSGEKLLYYEFNENGNIIDLTDHNTDTLIHLKSYSTYDANIVQVLNDQIWVLTKSGAWVYDRNGRPIFNHPIFSKYSLSDVIMDREGNIWLSSLNQGIIIVPNMSFVSGEVSPYDFLHATVTSNGVVYAMSNTGNLFRSNPPYYSYTPVTSQKLDPTPIYYDQQDQSIYLGNMSTCLDLNNAQIKTNSGNGGMRFKNIARINSDFLGITSFDRFEIIYQGQSDKLVEALVPYNIGLPNVINERSIFVRYKRCEDIEISGDRSCLYVDYIDGLICYHRHEPPEKVKFQESSVFASVLEKDKDKGIWIGTNNKDLLYLENGKVEKHYKLDGTPHHLLVHNGLLFIATNKGVIRLNIKNGNRTLINHKDGLFARRILHMYVRDEKVIAVTKQGIHQWPLTYHQENNIPPKVSLSSVQLFDDHLPVRSKYQLDANENNLTFYFSGMATRSQNDFTYQYRLTESNDWVTIANTTPYARFPKLSPGEYVFEYRACNEDGVCSEINRVDLTIALPLLSRPWVIVSIILGVLLILAVIGWWRLRVISWKNKVKSEQQNLRKETYKAKIAALRSQMNPHFMFNALNTIQEFIITNQQKIASEYLADFADLMRKYLNQSKQDEISIQEEIETLEIYLRLENLRYNNVLEHFIHCDPKINKEASAIPVMLIQPFIENSIKHGLLHKKGIRRLTIRFKKVDDQTIACEVEDNGVGRKASAKINKRDQMRHVSFATSAIDQKIALLNKNLSRSIALETIDLEQNGKPSGTLVRVTFQDQS